MGTLETRVPASQLKSCQAYYLSGSWNNWGPGGIAMIEEAPESQGMWNGIYEAGFAMASFEWLSNTLI
jgi:hypothetical protein